MEDEVEPGDVVVVHNVEAVLDSLRAIQLLAQSLEHLLELILGRVGGPRVNPVLNDLPIRRI